MKERIKLSIFWITSFIIIIFIMCFRVHAEEPYFPMDQNDNNTITSYVIDFINSDSDINIDNRYVVVGKTVISGNYTSVYVLTCPKETNYIFAEKLTNGYQFSYYLLSASNGAFNVWEVKYRTSNPSNVFKNNATSGGLTYFINLDSSLYNATVSYVSNLKVYTSANNDKQLVLNYGQEETPIDIGVAIIPPDAIVPDYPTGTNPPSQVPPTYTTTDYNWTTPPTFDSSSIENAIGSIQNTLGWLANNLKEEFKNLTNNLKGLFKYIGDTIQYYGNVITSTLNNFIKNFYDNMKSLVEPIFQKIDYITTPLEADVIWDNISGTSLITNYSSIMNAASSLKISFENLSEPIEYKIPIHLEDLPSSWFGNLTTQYIDLGVINPVKTILRTFMWALITYSLFVTIIDSIANYINGGGDES